LGCKPHPTDFHLLFPVEFLIVVCVGFGYVALYNSEYPGLFVASSVFIGPAFLCSVLSIASKVWLITERIAQNRQGTKSQPSKQSPRQWKSVTFLILAQRFVLRHDRRMYDERKRANDRSRYEAYGHMLGVVFEA
jgi:hypothetical protein